MKSSATDFLIGDKSEYASSMTLRCLPCLIAEDFRKGLKQPSHAPGSSGGSTAA